MNTQEQTGIILLAEDDPGDQLLIRKAFERSTQASQVMIVENGEDMIDYLQLGGRFTNPKDAPRPNLVLLDLNMPRKDGRTTLKEIKSDHDLRRIPVVVLTTSDLQKDIIQCYDLGANSFITKPSSFSGLTAMAEQLETYWFELTQTPSY